MCICRPRSSRPATARTRSIARGASPRPRAELRVRLAGRDLLVRVARDRGRDADQHRLAMPARRRRRSRRSMSSKLSITMWPTRRRARAQLGVVARVAVHHELRGIEAPPAARGAARRPRRRRSRGPPARTGAAPACGEGLRREHDVEVLLAGGAEGRDETRARGPAGRPRRRRRPACRSARASSITSQPPISRCPRSLTRLPIG
jgi:hypothetical protein